VSDHGHPLDDLAAYAVDALDDAERQSIDDHLAGCAACRDELAAHHETLAELTSSEPPPAAIWQRVAAGIGAPALPDPHSSPTPPAGPGEGDGTNAAQLGRKASSPGVRGRYDGDGVRAISENGDAVDGVVRRIGAPGGDSDDSESSEGGQSGGRRRSFRLGWLAAAASVAVALAIGGAVGFAVGHSSGGGDDADIGSLAHQASERPGGVLARLTDSDGRPVAEVVADQDGAYVVLRGLQNLPEGRAYQLWSLTGTQPVSLGMLGRDGTNTVAFRLPPTITQLAITVAPTNGDVSPSGDFLAAGQVDQA
jgi:anti-sigma-K factor RskA